MESLPGWEYTLKKIENWSTFCSSRLLVQAGMGNRKRQERSRREQNRANADDGVAAGVEDVFGRSERGQQ
jgi:hypothetical protein